MVKKHSSVHSLKMAVVKPLLKKNNIHVSFLCNYRAISNVPFIGKVIEKIVCNQTSAFLTADHSYDHFQLGFTENHKQP